jgi:hypothetical protein
MKGKGNSLLVAVAGVLVTSVLGQQSTAAPRYTVTAILPPAQFDYFEPRNINDRGQMLGRLDASTGPFKDNSHTGFYERGRVIDLHLHVPNSHRLSSSLPLDLNDHGVALFYGQGDGSRDRTFIYHHGRIIEFSRLVGRTDLDAFAINNRGEIVGSRFNPALNGWDHGFVWRHGQLNFLAGLAGYEENIALDINDQGLIVGHGRNDDLDQSQAAVFVDGQAVGLGIPQSWGVDVNQKGNVLGLKEGGGFIWKQSGLVEVPFSPEGFNDHDQVVGSAGPWPPHALLFENGATLDLNDLVDPALGWTLMYAFDINNRGEIVGWGRIDEHWSGFLLKPLP